MPIQFNCPACQAAHSVGESFIGKFTSCRNCGERLTVPGPEPTRTADRPAGRTETTARAAPAAANPPPLPVRRYQAANEPEGNWPVKRSAIPDLYELERRFRSAKRDLRDAEDREAAARHRLEASPVSEQAIGEYRIAQRRAKEMLSAYKAAKGRLDQIDLDIATWDARADKLRRQVRRMKFLTSPAGLGIVCSGEAAFFLLIALLLMIKISVGFALAFFVLLAFGAVSLTIIFASFRRRSLEPRIDYFTVGIEAAERGAAAHYTERSLADQNLRQAVAESNRADRHLEELSRRLRPLVRLEEAEAELEDTRRYFDRVRMRYEDAQTELRLRLLRRNWRDLRGIPFEQFIEEVFNCLGYHTEQTKASGDQGIDVIATKDGKRWGIQCKGYADNVGNGAVQEAHTGRTIYQCDRCMVVTNSGFTRAAQEAARHTECVLISGSDIPALIRGELRF